MKFIRSLVAALALAFASPVTYVPVVLTASVVGCASKPATVAYKTLDSANAAVKVSLAAWADYVVARKAEIALLPVVDRLEPSAALLRNEAKVINALDSYKKAVAASEIGVNAALKDGTSPSVAAVSAAAAAFVSVVASLK
jgi:hypothetical protein